MAKKKRTDELSRPRQHVVDEIAQNVFRSKLPPEWIRNELTSDYGKDYLIEVVDGTKPTGKLFIVQLKGTDKLKKLKTGAASFPMETVHLAYYQHKLAYPVFLVVVDTKKQEAFFTFVQQSLGWDNGSKPKQVKLSMHLRPENRLQDSARLLASVDRSILYMRDKYPGSINAAVAFEKKQLEQLDSRFKYDVSFGNGVKHIQISPESGPVPVTLHLMGKAQDTHKALHNLVNLGEEIESNSDVRIEISGSPLFESVGSIQKLAIAGTRPLEITLSIPQGDLTLPVLTCQTTASVALQRFRAKFSLPNCPFSGELTCDLKPERRSLYCNFTYRWSPEAWVKQPLAALPWFDRVCRLIDAMQADGTGFGLSLSTQGMDLGTKHVAPNCLQPVAIVKPYIEFLKRARVVAGVTRLPLFMPDDWSDQDMDDVEELWRLFTLGYYNSRGTVTAKPVLQIDPGQVLPDISGSNGVLKLTTEMKYNILGQSFEMPGAFYEFRDWQECHFEQSDSDPTSIPMVLKDAKMFTIWESCPWPLVPPA